MIEDMPGVVDVENVRVHVSMISCVRVVRRARRLRHGGHAAIVALLLAQSLVVLPHSASAAPPTGAVPPAQQASSLPVQEVYQGGFPHTISIVVDPRYPWLGYSIFQPGKISVGTSTIEKFGVEPNMWARWLANRDLDAFKASVDESLDMIARAPEGNRLLEAYSNIEPLPSLPNDIGSSQKHLFVTRHGQASPVKVVVAMQDRKILTSEWWTLDRFSGSNGRGSAGVIAFQPDLYSVARDAHGRPMLMGPAEALAHELVHGVHSLSGSVAVGEIDVVQVGPNTAGEPPFIEKNSVRIEELLTHGGPSELAAVTAAHPTPPGVNRGEERWANFRDASNAKDLKKRIDARGLPDHLKASLSRIQSARIAARGLSEVGIVGGMKIGRVPLPVRANYAYFRGDAHDRRFVQSDGVPLVFRFSGRQSDVPAAERHDFRHDPGVRRVIALEPVSAHLGNHAHPPCGSPVAGGCEVTPRELSSDDRAGELEKYFTQRLTDGPSARSTLASDLRTTGRPIDWTRLDKNKVLGDAVKVAQMIHNDPQFSRDMTQPTNRPMTRAGIENNLSAAKGALRRLCPSGANATLLGATFVQATFDAVTTWADATASVEEKVVAGINIVPGAAPITGIIEGAIHHQHEAVAVNTVALIGLVAGLSIPVVGEAITIGLAIYSMIRSTVLLWSTLSNGAKSYIRECLAEDARDPLRVVPISIVAAWCFAKGVSPSLRDTFDRWSRDPSAIRREVSWFFGGGATFRGDGQTLCFGEAGWFNRDGTYVPPPNNAGASHCRF